MAYVASYPATIKGHSKKADFDRCLDNQIQVAAEFDNQHVWSMTGAPGATDGHHNGIAKYSVSMYDSPAPTMTRTIMTVPLAEFTTDLWILYINVYSTSGRHVYGSMLLDSDVVADDADLGFQTASTAHPINDTTVAGLRGHDQMEGSPVTPQIFLSISGSNLLLRELTDAGDGTLYTSAALVKLATFTI